MGMERMPTNNGEEKLKSAAEIAMEKVNQTQDEKKIVFEEKSEQKENLKSAKDIATEKIEEIEKQEVISGAKDKIDIVGEKPLTPEEEAKNAAVEAKTRAQAITEGLDPDGTYAENLARMKEYNARFIAEGLNPNASYTKNIAILMSRDRDKAKSSEVKKEQKENIQEDNLEKERKSFDEISEQEQIQRFKDLKSLFADKYKLENDEDKKRANYFDFFKNIYKYTDRFDIGSTDQEKITTFNKALAGNQIINDALNLFLEVKKNQKGLKNSMKGSISTLELGINKNSYDFADTENYQLDVNKLTNLFKWSLGTFVKGGEKIRRTPGVKENEIKPMSEDLEAILKHVNAFR